MILWIVFALLTVSVIGVILAPLVAESRDEVSSADNAPADVADVAVYRAQLAEIELDRERGLIEVDGADGARAELGRRILAATEARAVDGTQGTARAKQNSLLLYVIALALPLASAGLYAVVGSPGLSGQPHSAKSKTTPEQSKLEKSVATVEAHLRDEPQDGRGWSVVAPIYLGLGRFEDARAAYRQTVLLLGPDVRRLSGLGRASVFAEKGKVTGEARDAFNKVLELDPGNLEARLWIARGHDQEGNSSEAIRGYEALLAQSGRDAPWRAAVEERLSVLRGSPGDRGVQRERESAGKGSVAPRIDKGKLEAVSKMSDQERANFVSGMVERLATRLKKDGSDNEGWLRLIRAYVVMGRADDAKQALADARRIFTGDDERLAEFDALAKELGLGT